MSVVRQETARLQAENSQLHIRLIQEAEKFDRQEKSHYQQIKKLEDRIAELSYWKQSASEKLMAADKEASGLRRKIDGLVKLNDKLTSGGSPKSCFTDAMHSYQMKYHYHGLRRIHGPSSHSTKDIITL